MAKAKKARMSRAAVAAYGHLQETIRRMNERITSPLQARDERARPHPFALGDRVRVPGHAGTQGVVNVPRFAGATLPKPGINEQQFYLTWVDDSGVGADGWFTAAELRTANPTLGDLMDASRRALDAERAKG
jgi:hypothetical protein